MNFPQRIYSISLPKGPLLIGLEDADVVPFVTGCILTQQGLVSEYLSKQRLL
jgi:hypothetical protein